MTRLFQPGKLLGFTDDGYPIRAPPIIGYRRNGAPIWSQAGGAPTRMEEIDARLVEVKNELQAIEKLPDPDGEEAQRAQTLADRNDTTDELLAEAEALETERKPLADRAARRARMFGAIHDIVEGGDGTGGDGGSQGGARSGPRRTHTGDGGGRKNRPIQ